MIFINGRGIMALSAASAVLKEVHENALISMKSNLGTKKIDL